VTLDAPMQDGDVRLEPVAEKHRQLLRAVCAADPEIWDIYPTRFFGEEYDAAFETLLRRDVHRCFVVFDEDELVGMTSYLDIDEPNHTLEIGRTYLAPRVRGTGFNRRMKQLMLDRAFNSGFTRVVFRIDTRNSRSMAAVEKLGAVREGTLRRNRITWTGYVRDTAVYSILADEWRAA